jgi:hypothetical protein
MGWAKAQIVIERKTVWNENKKLFLEKKKFEKVNLMMDSSNFQLFIKTSTSRKDSKWNYELNRPS